ncbi:hypothetical protein BG004_003368, partial [Podila humilis]
MALDPRKLKVQELKDQLQLAGLPVTGKKEDLVARLLEHQRVEEELNAAVADADDVVGGDGGPLTGSGDGFDWDGNVDDLAPPNDADTHAPALSSSSASTAPATTAAPATAKTNIATTTAAKPATSVTTPSTTTATTTTAPSSVQSSVAGGQDVEALQAEYNRRKNRAARFGVPLKEEDKALERAVRFGVAVTAKTTSTTTTATTTNTTAAATTKASTALPVKPGSIKAQIPDDVLSKRAARFGIATPTTTSTTTSSSSTTTTATATTTKPTTTKATAGTKHSLYKLDEAEEEKKRKRAAKFGAP